MKSNFEAEMDYHKLNLIHQKSNLGTSKLLQISDFKTIEMNSFDFGNTFPVGRGKPLKLHHGRNLESSILGIMGIDPYG